ncbi:unnamed protein product [Polarella glacialis]|uniref:Uncharacterized protein n=1 Tax=Polarella glacialis TaxID=89957 RepID=A0A813EP33_POLGL|nr:unnamed protein product [Polarella glacialis]
MKSMGSSLQQVLMRKWKEEEASRKSVAAMVKWRQSLIVATFVVRLKRAVKMSISAEAVKQFIEGAWKGFQIRSGMRKFRTNVRVLQNAMRTAVKLRDQVRRYIYQPSLWEVETQVLGERLKSALPSTFLRKQIAAHREAWCLEERQAEMMKLVREREFLGFSQAQIDRKAPIPKKGNQSYRSRRNAVRMDVQSHAIFSEQGQAILKFDDAGSIAMHPATQAAHRVIDSYRLDTRQRSDICRALFRQAVDRWWEVYKGYQVKRFDFQQSWKSWGIECQAMGPDRRDDWPYPPPIPTYPSVIMHVDMKGMTTMVTNALRRSMMGRNISL